MTKVIAKHKALFNIGYSIFAILSCVAIGKIFATLIPIIPASLFGLIAFTLTLHFRIFDADKVKATVVWCLKHMGVCFVPAGVGIINHFELIKSFGLVIVLITFATTFILLTLVGLFYQHHAESKE